MSMLLSIIAIRIFSCYSNYYTSPLTIAKLMIMASGLAIFFKFLTLEGLCNRQVMTKF